MLSPRDGPSDIAAANLTITSERQKLVDFTVAGLSNVTEVAVAGPVSPKVASRDDLSDKNMFVRKSTSYYENRSSCRSSRSRS